MRRRVPYCPAHLAEHDAKRLPPWPSCPGCGANDCWVFVWEGSVRKTTARCDGCGYASPALELFDELTLLALARPLSTKYTSGGAK